MRSIIASVSTPTVNIEYVDFKFRDSQKCVVVEISRGYEDGSGKFIPVFSESMVIQGKEYESLLSANYFGKKAGVFRTDDVWAVVGKMRAK